MSSLTATLRQKRRCACECYFGTTLINFMYNAPHKFRGYLSGNSVSVDQTKPYLIVNEFSSTFQNVFSPLYITDPTVEYISPGQAMEDKAEH